MSPRAFVFLFIAALVALIGAVALAVQPNLAANEAVGGEPMFAAVRPRISELNKVVIETPRYTATWESRNGTWVATDHGDYPTKTVMVANIVDSLASMTKVEPKTSSPDWYPFVMVGDPKATPPTGTARVTLASANGEVLADTIIGLQSTTIAASHTRGGTYVRSADDPQSWLVEGTVSLPPSLPDWFDTIINIPGPDIARVAILSGGKTLFEANKADAATGRYDLVQIDPAEAPPENRTANSDVVRRLVSATVAVNFSDVRALDSVTMGNDARIVRFTTTSGLQLDATLVEADGATWVNFKASAAEGDDAAKTAAQINALTDRWVFKLDDDRTAKLATKVSELVALPEPVEPPAGAMPGQDQMPQFAPGSLLSGGMPAQLP